MGKVSNTGGSKRTESVGTVQEVDLMTAQYFAAATKRGCKIPFEQEAELRDQLILMRHAERQDHADRAWRGTALLPVHDPPLSNAGRMQSVETALKYYAMRRDRNLEYRIQGKVSYFLVSPFHRCVETAVIVNVVAFGGALAIFVDPQLSDWQQTKVFRSAPTLGGYYTIEGDDEGELRFHPQLEVLRTSLLAFFRARLSDKSLPDDVAPSVVIEGWEADLDRWIATHPSLPVWTSASAELNLRRKLSESPEAAIAAVLNKPKVGKGGKVASAQAESFQNDKTRFTQCGVAYPESKSELANRCRRTVGTHYIEDAELASVAMVPSIISTAVALERRDRLPKYFQTFDERPPSSQEGDDGRALLPPTHVIAVTHADVVAGILEACCPKRLVTSGGSSVPYCSITCLSRHNNYYRIPPLEERLVIAPSSMTAGRGKPSGRGRKSGSKYVQPGAQTNKIPLMRRSMVESRHSLEWRVDRVGSTELLDTKIVVKFD